MYANKPPRQSLKLICMYGCGREDKASCGSVLRFTLTLRSANVLNCSAIALRPRTGWRLHPAAYGLPPVRSMISFRMVRSTRFIVSPVVPPGQQGMYTLSDLRHQQDKLHRQPPTLRVSSNMNYTKSE